MAIKNAIDSFGCGVARLLAGVFAVIVSMGAQAAVDDSDYMGSEVCVECHEDHGKHISHRRLGGGEGVAVVAEDCESCHANAAVHVANSLEGETDIGKMVSFSGNQVSPVDERNASCQQCHKGGDLMHWETSVHQQEDLACTSCHAVHRPSSVLERTRQIEVCNNCHKDIRAQTYRASTHPIQAAKTVCSDCHNAHGSAGPAELKQLTVNENCYDCHAEKRGPFLWEHEPASENCSLCHRVHGSNHPALLTRQGPQLCQSCHQDVRATDGRTHVRNFFDFDLNDPPGGLAGGTARGRFVVGQNCLNCHAQVHGSNHPSGVNLMR